MPLIQNEHWQRSAIIKRKEEGYIFRKENQEVKFQDNDATQVVCFKRTKNCLSEKSL